MFRQCFSNCISQFFLPAGITDKQHPFNPPVSKLLLSWFLYSIHGCYKANCLSISFVFYDNQTVPELLLHTLCMKRQFQVCFPPIIFPLPFFFPSFQAFFLHSLLSISQQSSILPSNSSCSGRERIFRKLAFSYARMALGLLLWGSRRRISTALFSFR